jgi:thiol:disulfide interchange protein DsbD
MLGVGKGLPLMVLAAGGHSLLPKSGPWLGHLKKVYAALMIGTGILVASRLLSGAMLLGLMAIIGVIIAGVLYHPVRHHRRFGALKLLSTLAVGYALAAGIGATQGHTDLLRPWTAPVAAPYDVVVDIASLQQKLKAASQQRRPVVVEISADWCLNCKVLESKLVGSEEARLMAAGTTWIKLDITEPNEATAAWLKDKGLFGPPAFLFFDGESREVIILRLIGEIELSQIGHALVTLLTP